LTDHDVFISPIQVNYLAAEMAAGQSAFVSAEKRDMDSLAREAEMKATARSDSAGAKRKFEDAGKNPDELDIDDDVMAISSRPVPVSVFGSLSV
jgi:hypothetical protein